MANDFLPGAAPDVLPGQSGGEAPSGTASVVVYTAPTPLLYAPYVASWANGVPLVTLTLDDNDAPLIVACADSPAPGAATNLDLTQASTIEFLVRQAGNIYAIAAMWNGGAVDAGHAGYNAQNSDLVALGVGLYEIGVQATFPGGPQPVFNEVALQIINTAP